METAGGNIMGQTDFGELGWPGELTVMHVFISLEKFVLGSQLIYIQYFSTQLILNWGLTVLSF